MSGAAAVGASGGSAPGHSASGGSAPGHSAPGDSSSGHGGDRVVPYYCPYCGDEDLRPAEVDVVGRPDASRGAWECRACARAFTVRFVGLVVRPVVRPVVGPGFGPSTTAVGSEVNREAAA